MEVIVTDGAKAEVVVVVVAAAVAVAAKRSNSNILSCCFKRKLTFRRTKKTSVG